MTDYDFREIERLDNAKTVDSRRSSRKGFITGAETHYIDNMIPLPLHSHRIADLERHLTELKKHVAFYNSLHVRYLTLTSPEGDPSADDFEAHELVRICYDELFANHQGLVDTVKVYSQGANLLTEFEYFESEDDKSSCRDAILELQRKVGNFRTAASPYAHPDLDSFVGNLTRRANLLVKNSKPIAAAIPVISATSSPSAAPVAATSTLRTILPQLNLPSFSGDPLDWTSFWSLLSSILTAHPGLPNIQKTTLLLSTLTRSEYIHYDTQAAGLDHDYDGLVSALKEHFELKRPIFNEHFRVWSSNKLITGWSQDLSDAQSDIKATLQGFQFCGACSVEHLTVAKYASCFSDKLYQRWQES